MYFARQNAYQGRSLYGCKGRHLYACRAVAPSTRHPSSINDCQRECVCARAHTHTNVCSVMSFPSERARRVPTPLGFSGKRIILRGECLGNPEHVTCRPLRCPTYVALVKYKTRRVSV